MVAQQATRRGPPPPTPITPESTIMIFDWDDTVLPSSWLSSNGLRLDRGSAPTAEQKEQLKELELAARTTFEQAMEMGEVVLVTNAQAGWIEMSCAKFFPGMVNLLSKIRISSARTMYESSDLRSPFDWKLRAFAAELQACVAKGCTNVVSLGDSQHEREAIMGATQGLEKVRTKSVKFVERPNVVQLKQQHQLLQTCLSDVINHSQGLDLCMRIPAA